MEEPQSYRAAPVERRGGPVRAPDERDFFGPLQPSGGSKPPQEKVAVGSSSAAPPQTHK